LREQAIDHVLERRKDRPVSLSAGLLNSAVTRSGLRFDLVFLEDEPVVHAPSHPKIAGIRQCSWPGRDRGQAFIFSIAQPVMVELVIRIRFQ